MLRCGRCANFLRPTWYMSNDFSIVCTLVYARATATVVSPTSIPVSTKQARAPRTVGWTRISRLTSACGSRCFSNGVGNAAAGLVQPRAWEGPASCLSCSRNSTAEGMPAREDPDGPDHRAAGRGPSPRERGMPAYAPRNAPDHSSQQGVVLFTVWSTVRIMSPFFCHVVEIPVARDQQARAHFLVTRTRETQSKCEY